MVILCLLGTAACGNTEVSYMYVLKCLCFGPVDLKDTLCLSKISDVILTKASTRCFAIKTVKHDIFKLVVQVLGNFNLVPAIGTASLKVCEQVLVMKSWKKGSISSVASLERYIDNWLCGKYVFQILVEGPCTIVGGDAVRKTGISEFSCPFLQREKVPCVLVFTCVQCRFVM